MYDANKNELDVLAYWDEHKCFEKSVSERDENKPYVFYDGPPFATGLPHYGHIVASLMKDVVPRYFTMRGYRVERKWGWDCHGLPIENIIEKDLNLNSKKDIENFGIDKFNEACNATVLKYAGEWKKTIRRMGRWVDMENDYKTMDVGYMESAWWVFKELWKKDLVYKGHKAMHVCPRCVTPLSNFEVTQGYKMVKDLSVTAKFKIKEQGIRSKEKLKDIDGPVYILAWTTTPWTLPGNLLLAVGDDIEYLVMKNDCPRGYWDMVGKEKNLKIESGYYIVAKDRIKQLRISEFLEEDEFGKFELGDIKIEESKKYFKTIKGSDLVGLEYEPLFPYFASTEGAFRVVAGDFVSTADGTGVVHIAPAFGDDDYKLGKSEGLALVQHVGMDGRFIPAVTDFAGQEVKPKDDPTKTDVEIIKWLAVNGKLFAKEKFEHSYPHCWRCDTPLLNYATSCWFIKVTELKDQLLKNNEAIHWVPDNFKQGRFGEWLAGARDWAVSRNRYWGNPLPVWESEGGDHICVGSVEELAELSGKKLTKIIFVRHGESEKNIDDIFTSAVDKYPLTEEGEKQVKEVAEKITDKIDLIISSPVLRTRQTAEIINKKLKADIIYDDLITEYNYGSWEDKSREDLNKQSDYQEYQKISASLEAKYNFRFAGDGESRAQITARVQKFLEKVSREHAGKTILVVSHGGINASMSKIIRGIDFDAFFAEERIGYRGVQYFYLNEKGQEYNLHKQFVDKIEIVKDGKVYHRVPDVLDCWFESGSMPYGQMHYPFENREKFEAGFPAQFIAEGQDQTRGWFYTLHVLATALTTGKNPSIPKKKTCPAFNNVIVNGIVLAEDGKKMSKRLKNYPEPDLMIAKYGADAMRYYLVTAPVMEAQALNFSEVGVREMYNKLVNTLWNVVEFYKMYATPSVILNEMKDLLKLTPTDSSTPLRSAQNDSENVLDKWILAKLNLLIKDVTAGMENYELVKASRPIVEFVTELSQWYVRRSRDRFKEQGVTNKEKGTSSDFDYAVATLREVLLTLSKVMAPFTPFMAEKIYQGVRSKEQGESESVHLESWPEYDEKMIDEKVLAGMNFVRKIVELGLSIRAFKGIKVKQPLSLLVVDCLSETAKNNFGEERLFDEMKEIIADELNVKEVKVIRKSELGKNVYNIVWNETSNSDLQVGIDPEITPALKAEGTAREIVRAINQMRKEMKLTISDSVVVSYQTNDSNLKKVIADFGDDIKKSTLTKNLEEKNLTDAKEIEIDGKKIKLFINLSS